ncbi:acyl-CoA N-acyltransferase [Hyaloraphidium curvatum]|nr:acyl-CoA N-acyltransferase [Hyaloraphidium curvatum]
MAWTIRPLKSEAEVRTAAELEALGYPEDEAASLDTLLFRFAACPQLFLGAFAPDGDELLGFIVATLTASLRLTHDSMGTHEPGGTTAAVHSVCVAKQHQRRGIALALLAAFRRQCDDLNKEGWKVERIALIAKEGVVPLYEKAGFVLLGRSEVVHGQDPWFELQMELGNP